MFLKTRLRFIATALCDIAGGVLPWLWPGKGGTAWLLLPAAASPAPCGKAIIACAWGRAA